MQQNEWLEIQGTHTDSSVCSAKTATKEKHLNWNLKTGLRTKAKLKTRSKDGTGEQMQMTRQLIVAKKAKHDEDETYKMKELVPELKPQNLDNFSRFQ